ncbi:MAG: DNA polymerase I, partial [Pseudobdellovibrionaceae bacterium]
MKKLFLVDVSSLFFRAFYAVRPLSAPSGMPTNAIYGFLSMIMKLLKDEKPEYLVFCYDRKEPSFRKDIYPEYKANRTEMPEDLVPQIPYIKKLAEVMGIPSLEVPGYEADDLIGTLTCLGRKHEMEVFIVSGDKDFAQLLNQHVYLYDTMKSITIDTKGAIEKWGVPPEQFIDFLALVGDASDNIPGVKGIGPKGAQKLLEEYKSLEGIYENIEKIKGALKDKLASGKENAFLSRKLSTIVTDCESDVNMSTYRRRPFHRTDLGTLFEELNFKTFEKNMWALDIADSSNEAAAPESPVQSMSSKASAKAKAGNDKAGETAAVEPTAPFIPEKREPHGFQLIEIEISELGKKLKPKSEIWGFSSNQGLFLAEGNHVYAIHGEATDLGKMSDQLEIRWKGFDLKTFWHLIQPQKPVGIWDSMLATYVIKPGESMDFDRVYTRMTGNLPMDLPSGADLFEAHLILETKVREGLAQVDGQKIFEELDLPLAAILYRMERKGISLDRDLLAIQSHEIAKDLQRLEKQIHELAGEPFNIGSPKQLANILFEKMKIPVGRKTKTGFSTDNEVLEKISKDHPIADFVLDYRELAKLKSTYVDSLPTLVKEDGRIHTTFNQALTTTGRLSSNDPNLQNIPIRTERGARVRKAFVAEKGNVLLSVDYSQIELRILAHVCEDPNLIRAFQDDLDIHTATAAEVFSVGLKEVTSEQRRVAKAVNFGIAYGQGAFGLAETLRIPRGEAAEIIKRYFTRFARVQNYIEDTIASAKDKGYVETLSGRKRYMDELRSKNGAVAKSGERAAINAPIQGTASDIVKKAMIIVDRQVDLPMLLQVHDELIFEGKVSEVEALRPQIVKLMESVVQLRVPLKANSKVGLNWDSAK